MYENKTFENILSSALSRVDNSLDKRQGSIIYDALAPFSAELAQLYIDLDINQNLVLPDTATGEYLTRLAASFGVKRKEATPATRLGTFYDNNNALFDISIGDRFSAGGINYTAVKRNSLGMFDLLAETPGAIGNEYIGNVIPITYISGLNYGTLTTIVVSGADVETDESLRMRLSDSVNRPPFGGNVAAYKNDVNAINGVGNSKVFPIWNGGGTVKISIIGSDYNPPNSALVSQVQNLIDPAPQGMGYGLAPIGHTVTVFGVTALPINVVSTFTLDSGVTPISIQTDIENKVKEYLLNIRQNEWADSTTLVVRISQIEARFLDVQGVLDVSGTTINGVASNLNVTGDNVPTFGSVTINV